VDTIGFNATNTGTVWSFTAATLSVNPSQITCSGIAGYNPASLSLSLTSAVPVSWTAAVSGPSWLAVNSTSGTSPTNLVVSFATAALAAGQYTNNIEFTVGALKLEVPVTLSVKALNINKMVADRQRPYLYAIQPPTLSGQSGLLLFINTTNGNVDKTLTIGINPVDLTINYPEGRIYIASWTETWTYVVDLATQTLSPSLNLGTDVYKINAGGAGRLVTEGEDQWVYMRLINTAGGAVLASASVREGDGEYDPTGRYYYHCENNISGAAIAKHDMSADTFVPVASAGGHYYYGSRNIVMSQDGSRVFWTSAVYDANLVDLGVIGSEIYSCSTNGSVAFGSTQAFDTTTRQVIYNLPASTSVSIVDGTNQRFWYFNSANATLGSIPMTVIESPSITQQPATTTSVSVGGAVYLTVTAMGLAPLSYQWTMFGTNLAGATNYFLSMPSLQPAQQGSYNVVVSNPFGTVTSTVAQVTVLVPASIASQSGSANVLAGQSFSLSVTPAGTAPFTYRWMFENVNISGGTNQTLTINNAQAANEGIYRVAVANAVGSVTGAPVSVRVLPTAPFIVSNPVSLVLPASSNATFGVTAIGSQPLAYQWFFQGTPMLGATMSQYAVPGVQSGNGGDYKVVVANSLGSATSAVATLTVAALAPYFTKQPVGAALSAGSTGTLTSLANGSQPIGYQWQRYGTNLPGATQTSLALTNLAVSDSGLYTLVASNVAGMSTSMVAQITVYQNPTLVLGLSDQVADINTTVTLTVNALGSPTPVYSWQLNGQPIAGSGPTLSLTNIQPSQSGYYRVIITNQYGSVSSTGRVSVLGWPSMVTAWGDDSGGQTNVPAGLNDIVAAAGGDYYTVALRRDGTLIAWGYNGDNQTRVPTNTLRFVSLASGAAHGLAITEKGSLAAWGRNDAGQCNVPVGASNNVLAVAAGDAHSLALLAPGTVVAWGDNSLGQCSVPQGLSRVRAIAAGRSHSLALCADGSVVGWGFNAYGQASAPALSNAVAIAAGYLHSVALLSNGTVVVWGDNTFGQANVPAGLPNLVAIAAGDFHTLGLRTDGIVVGWGDDSYGQIDVPGDVASIFAIASGYDHGLALVPTLGVLQPSLVSSHFVVRWSGFGTLQWATTPWGPYTDVGSQGNSYANLDMSAPARFFRLRR
jgi:alpha-tubulin suppressor-like RCC1 family protein